MLCSLAHETLWEQSKKLLSNRSTLVPLVELWALKTTLAYQTT